SSDAPIATPNEPDAVLRERLFGRTATESAGALRKTFGLETPGSISTKAASVSRTAERLVEVTLENGQVWRQEDAVNFSVRVGDTIEIEEGALGAYYLMRNGQGRRIRVTRVR
ncbi:MAG TPA: hypothetical protein VFT98_19940, partial [Myxococcota bacterium]|nr:hypothetical protein [Myxococcota bacterium]